MPVLAEARRGKAIPCSCSSTGAREGEINRFMEQAGLELDNVLLDSGGRLGQHVGSTALPTTVLQRRGAPVGSHLGELSHASPARALETLKEASTQ